MNIPKFNVWAPSTTKMRRLAFSLFWREDFFPTKGFPTKGFPSVIELLQLLDKLGITI